MIERVCIVQSDSSGKSKCIDPISELNVYSNAVNVEQELKERFLPSEYINTPNIRLLFGLNKFCQERLIRPTGTERQQLSDVQYQSNYDEIEEQLKKLGHIDKVEPQNLAPNALLLFGAAEGGFRIRLSTLFEHLEKGLKPDAIYLLGGQRPLWALRESSAALLLGAKLNISAQEVEKRFQDIKYQLFSDKELKKLTTEEVGRLSKQTMQAFDVELKRCGQKWPTELDMMKYISDQDEGLKKYGIKIIPIDTPM